MYQITWRNFSAQSFHNAQNKLRTAPLWGVRFRNRLMHDGESTTLRDAILRHREEAYESAHRFERMSASDQSEEQNGVSQLRYVKYDSDTMADIDTEQERKRL